MRKINIRTIRNLQLSTPNWLEGINFDDGKMNPQQYLKRYKLGNYFYYPKWKSYIFDWINATTCITKDYFNNYFHL